MGKVHLMKFLLTSSTRRRSGLPRSSIFSTLFWGFGEIGHVAAVPALHLTTAPKSLLPPTLLASFPLSHCQNVETSVDCRLENFLISSFCYYFSSNKDELLLYLIKVILRCSKRTQHFQPSCRHLFTSVGQLKKGISRNIIMF